MTVRRPIIAIETRFVSRIQSLLEEKFYLTKLIFTLKKGNIREPVKNRALFISKSNNKEIF